MVKLTACKITCCILEGNAAFDMMAMGTITCFRTPLAIKWVLAYFRTV